MASLRSVLAGFLTLAAATAASGALHSAGAIDIVNGDVIASTNNGTVTVYDHSLNFKETLNTGLGGFTTGTISRNGVLYVTDFSANAVSTFNHAGSTLGPTFGSGYSTPEAILFRAGGDALVTSVGGGGITHISAAGANIGAFIAGTRTDWMDLSADQTTLFYTDESSTIHRADLNTNTHLPDFGTTFGTLGFALRILPNSDVLVAAGNQISLVSATDALIRSYTDPSIPNPEWFALNLDPDGTSFWSGDVITGEVAQFDIASGALLQSRLTCGSQCLFGLSVVGERIVSTPEPSSLALLGVGLLGLAALRRRKSTHTS